MRGTLGRAFFNVTLENLGCVQGKHFERIHADQNGADTSVDFIGKEAQAEVVQDGSVIELFERDHVGHSHQRLGVHGQAVFALVRSQGRVFGALLLILGSRGQITDFHVALFPTLERGQNLGRHKSVIDWQRRGMR